MIMMFINVKLKCNFHLIVKWKSRAVTGSVSFTHRESFSRTLWLSLWEVSAVAVGVSDTHTRTESE